MEITKSFCNDCVDTRNHSILHTEVDCGSNDDRSYRWTIRNETLKCLGCDTVSLRRTITDNAEIDRSGNLIPTEYHFPPAAFRRKPDWISDLSLRHIFRREKEFLTDLLGEIYICIQNDCRRSAGMAVRSLLEHVMIDKVGDSGTFSKNILKFQAKGFISESQKEFLETVIEAGHATMHRAYKPSKEDVIALINIAESVIESCYVNGYRTAELKSRIPPRK